MSLPRAVGLVLLGVGCWALLAVAAGPAAGVPSAVPETAAQEDPRKGRLLFFRHCRACHSETGGEATAPDLKGLLDPADPRALPEESVREIIRDGRGAMKAFRDEIDDEELNDLIAYLKML